ncbi:uncharacterized protein CLUP02_02581 [Colletotrichum lupini]|uniref:Uncharacterized protein n=1 Tax=Colletotrichum lupini TaxID=145971 RepID=A0A9Q8SGZ8_9PEZI|nr:uncharacterized protein CLUP02_02581 [Colletotrichum lupini]UQC77114.1 hypothetical protein CLUP02_02581 [Colletotrichum lupini]
MRDDTIVAGLSVPSSARPSSAFVSLQKGEDILPAAPAILPPSLTYVPETGGRVAAAATLGGRIAGAAGRISSPLQKVDSPTIIDIGNRGLDGGGQLNQAQVTGLERNCPVLPCQRSSVFAPANDHHLPHPRLNIADYMPLTATRSHLDPTRIHTFCHSSTLCRPVSPVRNHAPPPLLKQPDAPQGLPPRPSTLDPRPSSPPFCPFAHISHHSRIAPVWLTPGFDSTASRKSHRRASILSIQLPVVSASPPTVRPSSPLQTLPPPPFALPILSLSEQVTLLARLPDALTEQPGTPFQAQRRTIANSSQPACLLRLNNTLDDNLLL